MIHLRLDRLPPSSNKAYVDLPRGGRTLSSEGKRFKRETIAYFSQKYPKEMTFFKPNTPYGLVLIFFMESLENKGFKTGKADNRYKILDGGNRTKLLEDSLKDAAGVDDSQFLWTLWEKRQLPPLSELYGIEARLARDGAEYTDLWVWNLETEPANAVSTFLGSL